jgi:hypothetical protein
MHKFLNTVEVLQSYECVVKWFKVKSIKNTDVENQTMAAILIASVVSWWRPRTVPNWVKSGNCALLFRHVCVLGMLAQVPLNSNLLHNG